MQHSFINFVLQLICFIALLLSYTFIEIFNLNLKWYLLFLFFLLFQTFFIQFGMESKECFLRCFWLRLLWYAFVGTFIRWALIEWVSSNEFTLLGEVFILLRLRCDISWLLWLAKISCWLKLFFIKFCIQTFTFNDFVLRC